MRSLFARLRRVRVLEPLAERDFALLTAGSFIPLLGDGFFYVALADAAEPTATSRVRDP